MTAFISADGAALDGTHNERREDHHVLVEGRQIREVSDRPIKSASAEMIELGGRTLMPRLIDAHVHVLAVDAALARLFAPAGYAVDFAGGQGARGDAAARLYDDPRRRGGR
jgi:imidazolonepropionase-like amidohydrolase